MSTSSWLGKTLYNDFLSESTAINVLRHVTHLSTSHEALTLLALMMTLAIGMFMGGAFAYLGLGRVKFHGWLKIWDHLKQARPSGKMVKGVNGHSDTMEKNYVDTPREAGVDPAHLPKHISIILDGNRRYGKRVYGKGTLGHVDGGKKVIDILEWAHTEGIKWVTLYSFSTENWNRPKEEVDILMNLFSRFLRQDLRPIIINRKMKFHHLSTGKQLIPDQVMNDLNDLKQICEPFPSDGLNVNVCMNYGSRAEIADAVKLIGQECVEKRLRPDDINEDTISSHLGTAGCPDPDLMMRTSGEYRLSNFLLWQHAYSEFFFLEKDWPEVTKDDFLRIVRTFANSRKRRYGT